MLTLILVCAALLVAGYVLINRNKKIAEMYSSAKDKSKQMGTSFFQSFHRTKVEAPTSTN